jgi:hypothetical protein
MDATFNNTNYLFILANQGAGGHRLGRIISCFNNVYWYSSKHNGEHPWDVFFTEAVSGKNISQYHDYKIDVQPECFGNKYILSKNLSQGQHQERSVNS